MNIWFRFLELNFSMVLNEPGYTHGPSRVLVVMDKCHPGRTELSCLILSTVSRPIPWVMSLLPYAISRVCNSSPSSSSPPASSSSSSNHFWIAIIATIFHRHGNHGTPIFHGKIHYKWPFSIAMLVHQRVTHFSETSKCNDGNCMSSSSFCHGTFGGRVRWGWAIWALHGGIRFGLVRHHKNLWEL